MTQVVEPQVISAEEDDFDDFLSSSDEQIEEPPRKRRRAVTSFVRHSQRVRPSSAYWGTEAYGRAIQARPENDILTDFVV